MNPNRYIRQTSLKDFGPKAQQKLGDARVLVVGLGGLGIPVLQYLNAMGVGALGLIDQDVVDLTNLQRQVLYSEGDIGKAKLEVALQKLEAQNSETNFHSYDSFLVRDNALKIIKNYDLVIDASDNFGTRYLINDVCVILGKPFVYGALHGFEGQVSVFNFKGGPTYRCLFPEMPSADEIPNCDENGVLGIIPGIVGNLQALEAIKVLTGVGEVLSGELLLFDGLQNSFQRIRFHLNPDNLKITDLQDSYEIASCETLPSIGGDQLKKILNSGKRPQLIDVRSPEEYSEYHLEGSVNVPLSELPSSYDALRLDHPVVLICQSGKRSERALKKLQKDFQNLEVYHLEGGLNKYGQFC